MWGEQAVQPGQPWLQRRQCHNNRDQHRWVSGQSDQSAQRGWSRYPARQVATQSQRRLPSCQRHTQLGYLSGLTPTPPVGTTRPKHVNTYVPICSCSLLTRWSVLWLSKHNQYIDSSDAPSLSSDRLGLFWPKECPEQWTTWYKCDWPADALWPFDPLTLWPYFTHVSLQKKTTVTHFSPFLLLPFSQQLSL